MYNSDSIKIGTPNNSNKAMLQNTSASRHWQGKGRLQPRNYSKNNSRHLKLKLSKKRAFGACLTLPHNGGKKMDGNCRAVRPVFFFFSPLYFPDNPTSPFCILHIFYPYISIYFRISPQFSAIFQQLPQFFLAGSDINSPPA